MFKYDYLKDLNDLSNYDDFYFKKSKLISRHLAKLEYLKYGLPKVILIKKKFESKAPF